MLEINKNYSIIGNKLVLFNNVTEIVEDNFENFDFTEVEINAEGNFKIGENAFKNFKKLRFIRFTNNPKIEVGNSAFEGLEELTKIEKGIFVSVGENAFKNCKKLDCIYLAYATYISETAFMGCDNFYVSHFDVSDNEYLTKYVEKQNIYIE